MNFYWRSILASVMVGAYVACAPVKFDENQSFVCNSTNTECSRVTPSGIDYSHRVNAPGKKVDILFVVDNSGSMSFEQNQMARRFDKFLVQLDARGLDYHIAITTTDISSSDNSARSINKHGLLQDGKLVELLDDSGNGTGRYIIKSSLSDRLGLFNNTIKRPETLKCEAWLKSNPTGSDPTSITRRAEAKANCPSFDERGIVAADKAVQRNEHGFLRSNAHFAVVIISDEDERSFGADATVNSLYANFEYKILEEDRPETFIENFKYKFGVNKTLAVHSIIVKPGDTPCLNAQNIQANGVKGYAGDFYKKLSDLTSGVVGDICASNYTNQLSNIGTTIVEQTASVAIHCSNPNELSVTFNPSGNAVPYRLSDSKIIFDQALNTSTGVTVTYSCNK